MSSRATVAKLGEFGLIGRLAGAFASPLSPSTAPGLKLGIGDDAAVWAPTLGTWSVITTDALIEGVHFRLSTTSWYDLGWKSLAVNLSDVAAMGAHPRYAVVCLGVPGSVAVCDMDAFGQGLADAGGRYSTALVGGDTVAAACVTIAVTVVGETRPAAGGADPPLLRRGAGQVGDSVAVTGALGAAAGGLRLLEAHTAGEQHFVQGAVREALCAAHRRPTPRVAEAAILVDAGVRCAMDLSDGLLGDARHVAEASHVGVVLEAARVPVAPELIAAFPADALALALGGGEDYELLCTGPAAALAEAARVLAGRGGPALTVVGRLVSAPVRGPRVLVLDATGAPLAVDGGFVHFRA